MVLEILNQDTFLSLLRPEVNKIIKANLSSLRQFKFIKNYLTTIYYSLDFDIIPFLEEEVTFNKEIARTINIKISNLDEYSRNINKYVVLLRTENCLKFSSFGIFDKSQHDPDFVGYYVLIDILFTELI